MSYKMFYKATVCESACHDQQSKVAVSILSLIVMIAQVLNWLFPMVLSSYEKNI